MTTLASLAIAPLVSLAESAAAHATPAADDVPANLAPPAGSVLLFELDARGV